MAQIKITLTKSPIGRKPEQRKTVVALGLGKLNSSVVKEDNAAIRGMVNAVSHLVTGASILQKEEKIIMKLHELKPAEGSRKVRNRVGRGTSSGNGKTSGRGQKGQKARSGGGVRPGFEGGQTPLFRRLPKRGFTNINAKEYALVNLDQLNVFEDGTEVTPAVLKEAGIVRAEKSGVKVLGNGELTKKLTVKAAKFSKSAEAAITAKGGSVEVI